jgi:hypothetical protein
MDYDTNLMFETPALENVFRAFICRGEEMGGYFFTTHWPRFTEGMHWKKRRALLEPVGNTLFIRDWLFIPNMHPKPEHSYNTVNRDFDRRMAELNTQSKRPLHGYGLEFPFHTHPAGSSNGLSAADINAAMAHHWDWHPRSGRATTIVASSYPLRVILYNVFYSKDKYPVPVAKHGEFHSWLEKRFKDWRQLVGSSHDPR